MPLSTAAATRSGASRRFKNSADDYRSLASGLWVEEEEEKEEDEEGEEQEEEEDDEPTDPVPEPEEPEHEESPAPSQSVNFSGWDTSGSAFTEVRRGKVPRPSLAGISSANKTGWAKVKVCQLSPFLFSAD